MYQFAFARRENLLDESLHGVEVHCVCVDVTSELMEVPTLNTSQLQGQSIEDSSPDSTCIIIHYSNGELESYFRVEEEVAVSRFSISPCSPDLLDVALKALKQTSTVR